MIARRTYPATALTDPRRTMAWIGFIVLLLSLLAPQLSIESAEAAQTLTSQQEECDEGFILNERTGECDREPQRVPAQITIECPEGTVLDQATGGCVPVREPEPTIIDAIQIEPTSPPELDDIQAEPTSAPEPTMPTEVVAEPTAAPPPVGYVQAIKHACPETFAPDETITITELQETCLDPIEGVLFHVLTGDVIHASLPTDGTGLAQLGSAPVGEIALAEEIPAGYGEPIVYCADGYAFGPFEHTYTEDDRQELVDGNAIAWSLEADTLLQCHWYNVATGTGQNGPGDLTAQNQAEGGAMQVVTLTNRKFRCPLGAPHEEFSFGEMMELCAIEMEDVEFTFDDGVSPFTVETDQFGEAIWLDPPAGEVTVRETIPEGYGDPYVACRGVPEDENQQVLWIVYGQVPGGELQINMGDPPESMECHWTNVPTGDDHTVTIEKRICPPNLVVLVDENGVPFFSSIEDACVEPGNGIPFTIQHADGNETLQTVGGNVTFDGVPGGPFSVTEDIPPGFGEPRWYCNFAVPGQPFPEPEYIETQDGVLSDELDSQVSGTYRCWVFNTPPQEDRTVTVWKWQCPAGLQPESQDLQDWLDTCVVHPSGIDFTLADASGELTKVVDGTTSWYGTEPGLISITEHTPPAYHAPYVFCQYYGEDDGAPVSGGPDMLDVTDSTIEVSLPFDQYSLICHFFNVADDVGNSITNVKFLCPPGYDFDAMGAHPPADCTETHDGATFALGDGNAPDPDATGQSGDDGPGRVIFDKLDPGTWTVTEEVPPGIVDVRALCPSLGNGPVFSENPPRVEFDVEEGDHWGCLWFNVPEEPGENTVEIRKWECPEGTEYGHTQDWYEANCVTQHNGVEFTVTSDIGIAVQETAGGVATFPGLPEGTVGIQETIPDGFGPPVVFCGIEGVGPHYPAPTGYWEFDFASEGGASDVLVCLVYNIPGQPGSVTINKWTCPPGYDLFAAGADPKVDCTLATNGVQFQFGPDAPAALAELQTTGDVIDGGVVFDGLEPGVYKAVELVPEGIASVFVLECTGHTMGVLQPYPLAMGDVLDNIDLDAGEHLVCDWYNVPDVGGGELTLIKYVCATETFISEVDCEIYEDVATFDLLWWDGVAWQVIDTEITDAFGRISWVDLTPGDYWLDEHDGQWCHLTATPAGDDDSFPVNDGEETVVEVYNCDASWTTTGKIPEKYPNTGVPSDDEPSGSPERLPAAPLLAGLLATAMSRRRLAALAAGSLGIVATGAFAQDREQPASGTPVAASPRGPVPARLEIAAIGVDAPVEVLETVAGVMQQPSDEAHVAWYKESARLGEPGNIWIAGHLNWWNSPEAVFSDLGTLQEGDEVVLRDAANTAYTYGVEWVRQESNLAPPREDVLGMTDHEAVTLITCGGEWDNTISEYNARTVVRANRVLS